MVKAEIDICDLCDQPLMEESSGILIAGENITINWVGKNSPMTDIFPGEGSHAPMNGRVSLTLCIFCLKSQLGV